MRIAPLSPVDLDEKAGDPGSAWPVAYDELRPLYNRAQRFLGLPDDESSYEPSRWAKGVEEQLVDEHGIRAGVFQFADAAQLIQRSVKDLSDSTRTRTMLHATVVEILTNADGSVATGVRAASAPGRHFTVRARFVVLAAGTVSTTQLLLASRTARAEGLGNEYDLVGRYFMDHLLIRGGTLTPASRNDFAHRAFYDMRLVGTTPVLGHLQLSPEVVRRDGLLNLSFVMFPREELSSLQLNSRQKRGVQAGLKVRERLVRRRLPQVEDAARMLAGADGVLRQQIHSLRHPRSSMGRGGWSTGRARDFADFEIMHQAEQSPHKDNRITLSDRRDSFGLPKVDISVTWREDDVDAIVRAQDSYASSLAAAGWGQYRPARIDGRPVVHSPSSNHFMGTTRMHESPRLGVVDANGAVHGTPNLFVASTSLLPTGGWANVTLTGLALSMRVADALIRKATSPITLSR